MVFFSLLQSYDFPFLSFSFSLNSVIVRTVRMEWDGEGDTLV